MWDQEIKGMASAHMFIASAVFVGTLLPAIVAEKFSVYGSHLVWVYSVAGSVAAVNVAVFWLLGVGLVAKKNTLSYKVSRMVRSGLHFTLSCFFYHIIVVLYGAPLLESVLETFSLAVLLSTFTTLRCLCLLGPNVQAWIRVFSRDGAMSVWDTSLQITTACSVIGAWLGAFPIPLDWDRPWQVWPISCTLGATFGFLSGLVIAPVWIHWHRKQLTYKSK
ncbi:phosphatidylinositol-glycan biosynthesis class F protein-like [Scleropages formosus]|uniref:Phosphatidylinositol glycan anchor biosynthesis, class F n=1 Tax=Scleropages formosus TaxID=113540 RepID=A0A0P7V742_SCLFO|nr:phosphatidylinositol-glycan biosynthesis class F protein [Scleropages formosus]XP_018602864.1 phosphatidylinositol-glycan biosynthesis class F protein [Scleropages formosus]XP_029106359.1 phosphatidylinositol-glycan biosynthesis class F protein [Scleropages formosus]KPP70698.1 phosphatidylinositol-glycan biosynthesis class F protein-like [Scleropages formosus]